MEIVTVARTYIGVPFVHQRRGRGGVDCLGLLMLVAGELDLCGRDGLPLVAHDVMNYSKTPNVDALLTTLNDCLTAKSSPQVGDIALFNIDGNAQHLGIIGNYHNGGLGLIHAYASAGAVVEHNFSVNWQRRLVQLFAIP